MWIIASSVPLGLIGVVASRIGLTHLTEARVRGTGDLAEAHQATRLWRLGVFAFLPAWVIVLSGHAVR